MVETSKIVSIGRKSIRVIPEEAGLYPSDDLPAYIDKLEKRLQKKTRNRRADLVKGNVVVVLEGVFTAKRVVFLKQLENNMALCCGPRSINSVPFFAIDEKYLLKTSTVLDFKEDVDIDLDSIFESKRGESADERMDFEPTNRENEVEKAILKQVDSIKLMKRYLATPFKIPEFKDVSSLNF